MKKYKMIALTGILLSSTILGANTSVIQASAANTNKAIDVDTSGISKALNVINELLGSSTTANTVNPQTQFSDLEDGSTQTAAPIFGKKSATDFANKLQSELNVVDSNNQLVPMTVVTTDSTTGFASKVSYTLDGVTKTVSVDYSYALPTVSFKNGNVMNFASTDEANTYLKSSAISAETTNGDTANGTANSASVSANPASVTGATTSVKFTPKDMYRTGIIANGTVNVYSVPTISTRTVSSDTAAEQPYVVQNASGQRYLVTPTVTTKETSDDPNATVSYVINPIDSLGNIIKDTSTGSNIEFKSTGTVKIVPNTDDAVNYTMVFKDPTTKKVVYTKDAQGKKGTVVDSTAAEAALEGTGYALTDDSQSTTLGTDTTEVEFDVTKDATTTINYIDVTTGQPTTAGSTETLKGNNGKVTALQNIPDGYRLVNMGDLLQTLNADNTSKDVYVTPIKSLVKDLSYTVTFKDKDTGKTIDTQNDKGNLGQYVSLTAPSGYAFATVADHGFLLLKDGQTVTKYVTAANVPYKISYVDQDTNKEVDTESGKGADGSDVTLTAPDGYAFVNADDMTYTIDKNDTTTKTVYVKKSNQTVDNIVAGYPKNGYIKIYDGNGKLNNDVVLSEGSSWIIDKTKSIGGVEYYRVATNEYVKASDVYKYTPKQGIVTTKGVNVTPVYNSRGQLVIDLALDTNTPWYTDRYATIKGTDMYRVATDEWVKASDITVTK